MANDIGLANAYGAQAIAQGGADLTGLLSARLMAARIAAAQQQAAAMDTTGTEKPPPMDYKAEDIRLKRSQALEDQIARRNEFGAKQSQDQQQFEAKLQNDINQFNQGLAFKQSEAERDQGNVVRDFGLKAAHEAEFKRSNLADEALKGRQVDASLQKPGLKPATPAERQSLAFFNRAQDAVKTITDPGAGGKSLEDQVAKSGIMTQAGLQYLPNALQTTMQQSYRQAQRAFTEARLRKESGAAIPESEFQNDAKTYFAQPGDGPAMIDQKRKARETLLKGMRFASGKAYGEFYGAEDDGATPGVPTPPAVGASPIKITSIKPVNP